jgi:hypothetical protein
MKLYLDDDSASALLTKLLRQAAHEVQIPVEVNLTGASDAVHPTHAIREGCLLLSANHDDFFSLHHLLVQARGHHPGIIIVRRDNDPRRDLTASGIVRALGNLVASSVPLADGFHILNHWR